ncbi:MAG: AEC family transporter [Planctomycetota bacterium]
MPEVLLQFGHVAYFIVLPLMLLMGLGFVVQRVVGLDMPTLVRLNFYVVVPGMVYTALVESEVTLGHAAAVVGVSLAVMALMAAALVASAWLRGLPRSQWSPLVMTGIFYNAGNYGLPLQQLAFRSVGRGTEAMGMQVFIMIVQNVTSFTIGIALAAGGGLKWERLKKNLIHILKLPPLYALAAAIATISARQAIGARSPDTLPTIAYGLTPFLDTLHYVQNGFVVVALVTLGAKLATVTRGGTKYPVTMSVVFRLLLAPAIGLLVIKVAGLEGFVAQVLLISTATPTSVNCMLICLEFDNHPDFVARSVFYSTMLSPVTVTAVVLLAQSGLVG